MATPISVRWTFTQKGANPGEQLAEDRHQGEGASDQQYTSVAERAHVDGRPHDQEEDGDKEVTERVTRRCSTDPCPAECHG